MGFFFLPFLGLWSGGLFPKPPTPGLFFFPWKGKRGDPFFPFFAKLGGFFFLSSKKIFPTKRIFFPSIQEKIPKHLFPQKPGGTLKIFILFTGKNTFRIGPILPHYNFYFSLYHPLKSGKRVSRQFPIKEKYFYLQNLCPFFMQISGCPGHNREGGKNIQKQKETDKKKEEEIFGGEACILLTGAFLWQGGSFGGGIYFSRYFWLLIFPFETGGISFLRSFFELFYYICPFLDFFSFISFSPGHLFIPWANSGKNYCFLGRRRIAFIFFTKNVFKLSILFSLKPFFKKPGPFPFSFYFSYFL